MQSFDHPRLPLSRFAFFEPVEEGAEEVEEPQESYACKAVPEPRAGGKAQGSRKRTSEIPNPSIKLRHSFRPFLDIQVEAKRLFSCLGVVAKKRRWMSIGAV